MAGQRAALYVRVSTGREAEPFGLQSQYYALVERARERAYVTVADGEHDAFIDAGCPGASLDRPALDRLRRAVHEGRLDVVLCYGPEYLAADAGDRQSLGEEFGCYGVRLEFLARPAPGRTATGTSG